MAHSNINGIRKVSRYHRFDDIPTNTFTPRTYQIQLLDAALKRNTLLCLGCPQSKVFLALMVAKELASPTRQPGHSNRKVAFYLTDSEGEVNALYETLPHHTDLQIGCCPLRLRDRSSETAVNAGTDLQEWTQLMETSNILVCHGPVFLEAVQKNYVRLKDINLLIFDDCHKSVEVENHPYAEIVALVKCIPQNDQPHILGVTASVAGTECSDPFKLQETISAMEITMHAYAETSMLILSERFGCHPKESVVRCIEYEYDDEQMSLRTTLEDILEQNYYFFNNCQMPVNDEVDNRDPREIPIQVLSQCLSVLNILGTWCTSSISEYFVMQLEKIVKYEKNDIHKRFLRCVITSLRFLSRVFEMNFHPDYDVDELLEYTTPKVRELIRVLRNYKPELDFVIISNDDSYTGDDFSDISDDDSSMSGSDDDVSSAGMSHATSKPVHIAVKRTADGGHEHVSSLSEEEERNLCGIVFVENRYIAFGLNKVIEEVCSWDENLCFVKSCHITGQGLQGTNGKQKLNRTFKRQEEALRKFRTQECNLVIATLELEEGVDIPKCNLVVRFDPPHDYRSYTLSKGRARARDASYVILLDQQSCEQFESNLRVFKGIEQVLLGERSYKHASTFKTDKEDIDDQDSDDSDNDVDEGHLLPPYCTIPNSTASPQVTIHGAIALINRYCAKLPSDAFTHLTPQCRLEKVAGDPVHYVAFLRLPINSPIKAELKGPAMKSKKLAKMAVALKMCAILHKSGELDENLIPVGKEMFLYEEEEEWADEEDLTGLARPGTTKRKQYYVKKVADAVVQSLPKAGEPSYLYLINLQLTGPITDEQNTRGRVIYAPEDTMQTLGILLSKPIPQVPNFPVYTRSGEVTVSIDLFQNNLVLSEDEVSRLLMFHHFVFSGVLHLEKDPMEFDPVKAECGLIVVPLYGKGLLEIEWSFVDRVIQFMKMKKHAGFSRKNPDEPFVFCVDEFKDAVVMPSYRNIDQPQHFYVAEILQDLNPLSPFPSPELYKTFQDYYTIKYGLVITNTEQPLLDVDHTSARLNLLTPRYMNQKGVALPTSSAETKRARRENLQQKQILVPELCDIHVFPASLWRKAVCLPAVLYRVNNLLLAEELRCKISKETGIGIEKLPENFSFPKLDFGFETSPVKLREAELSSGKRLDQSSSFDVGNERFEKPELVCHTAEESVLTAEDQSQDLKLVQPGRMPPVNLDGPETLFKKGNSPVDVAFASDEKTDSASSSDSDSGIASSGSDTNIGASKSTLTRGSPDVSDAVPCESRASSSFTKLDAKISQCSNIPSCGSSDCDCNPTQQCSSHDYICNITSQGSSVSSTCGNGFNQCNIISRNEVAKPLYNSYLNGQPDGRSSTTSTSSVINSEHCIVASASTANSFLSSSSSSGISCNSISSTDVSMKSAINDANIYEENTFTNESITSATAGACIKTHFSNVTDKLHANSDLAGATTNAAVPRPCSTSSTKTELSASTTCLHAASVSLQPCSLSDSGQISQSANTETPATGGEDTPSRQPSISPSMNISLSSEHREADSSKSNCLHKPPSSSAASTEAQCLKTDNGSVSVVELHDTKGCDYFKSLDSCPALHEEIHPMKAHESIVCDTCAQHNSTCKQDIIASVLDHHCVHNVSAQNTVTDTSTFSTEINKQEHSKYTKNAPNGVNLAYHVMSEPSRPLPAPPEKGSNGSSSIIMNTLGQELIGLDIDLIIPQASFSETFHSSEHDDWGTKPSQKEHLQNVTDSWESNCESNVRDFLSKCPDKDYKSESEQSMTGESKTQYPDPCCRTDDDIIKFSFATDSLESGNSKKDFKEDFVADTWMSGTRETCKQANINRHVNEETDAPSLTSTASTVPKTDGDQSSSMHASECKYADFEIGVWKKQRQVRDKHQYVDSSFLAQGQSMQIVNFAASSSQSPDGQQQHVSLDEDRDLETFRGPSPCVIMQALTMSNANDFFSLERLETIGDSFLKYAITVYLYCCYPGIHEGKLSYLRSKQVSNYNLYRLGRRKCLAESMVSTKFEPYENWLPPGYIINEDRRRGPVPKVVIVTPGSKVTNASRTFYLDESGDAAKRDEAVLFNKELEWIQKSQEADQLDDLEEPGRTSLVPYSLQRHHGLPDKSVADCVEALIGCYLTTCGRKAALMFMSWLGLKVLPKKIRDSSEDPYVEQCSDRGSTWKVSEQEFDELQCPPSPMFSPTPENMAQLEHLLEGFDALEEKINYKFRDRSYLLQAFTHASYHYNTITDCYQRVEFLGDAILDYVITRHLYEDSKKYSPGILTDLRSALVNNNIFAALAVKWGFHKYFKAISPSLFQVIDKFVKRQKEKNQDDIDIDEEYRELSLEEPESEDANEEEDDDEEVEMEIPKALGDIFESVAGAIYLDSGMSLETVWRVYYRMMKPHIDKYLKSIPKSPVRELLETEPETAKFERPERTMNGKVRVTVNVVGKGVFSGVGRNYRIAKSAAAKKALRSIRLLNQNLVA